MELANNALQISREGMEFKNILVSNIEPSTRCYQLFSKLSQCVLSNKLNILDKEAVRSTCEVEEWRGECPGAVQRNHIEKIYRRSVNQRLYTQDQLNKYMETKNNNTHYGMVDHRY